MPYLILGTDFLPWKKRQMDRDAVRITEGVWLYNKKTEGGWPDVVSVRIDESGLKDLTGIVEPDLLEKLRYVEGRIVKRNLQGKATKRLSRVLGMVIELSLDFDTVEYARDLLFALNEGICPGKPPEEITPPRGNPLGMDRDSVKKYLLSVAKKEPIH